MSHCCCTVDLRPKQTDDYAYAPSSAWLALLSLLPSSDQSINLHLVLYISGLARPVEMLTDLISLDLAISSLVLVNTIVMNGPDKCDLGA